MGNMLERAQASTDTSLFTTRLSPFRRIWNAFRRLPGWLVHLILLGWCISVTFPMVWLLISSFKSTAEILVNPWGLPQAWIFGNYREAWVTIRVGTYFLNSVMYVSVAIVCAVMLNAMAAYTLARYDFRGNRTIFFTFVAGLLFPAFLGIVPWYFLMQSLHLLGSRIGLIISWVVSTFPFGIFLLTGFFRTLPSELEDAAVIDGASQYTVFFWIYLPLARPGLITVAIFQFLYFWNDFLTPLLVLGPQSDARPLASGLQALLALGGGGYIRQHGIVFAAVVIMLVPGLILYLIFQRQLMQGINVGALKG